MICLRHSPFIWPYSCITQLDTTTRFCTTHRKRGGSIDERGIHGIPRQKGASTVVPCNISRSIFTIKYNIVLIICMSTLSASYKLVS